MKKANNLSQSEIHSFRGMSALYYYELIFTPIFFSTDPAVFDNTDEDEHNHFTVSFLSDLLFAFNLL